MRRMLLVVLASAAILIVSLEIVYTMPFVECGEDDISAGGPKVVAPDSYLFK